MVGRATWTLLHTFADDATYASTETQWDAYLEGQTYGKPPFTLAISWQDIPAFEGLLDTYPGAAAAYSVRLLDSTYTGDCIRVRRASDNTEQDIGFDGNGDLDTGALASFCAGTNGFVKTWYDQSGNGNDATQATTANQPKVYDSVTGVVLENALAAMSINGSVFQRLAITNPLTGQPATVFCVYKASTTTSFPYNSSTQTFTHIGRRSTGEYFLSAGNVIASGVHPSTQVLSTAVFDGASSVAYWNGVSQLTGNAGANAHIDVIGSFPSFDRMNGTIQEIIIYASDQSANRAGIEANINAFYSIY